MKKKTADLVKVGAEITAGSMFGPSGSMVVKLLGSVLTPLAEYVGDRRERRAKEFVEHFMGSGYPNETAAPLLEAEIRRAPDATKDAVSDALRALDDTLSDRVTPALAILARDYLRAGLPKDRFFVSAVRLLRDLEDREYEDLRDLVLTVAALFSNPPANLHVECVHLPSEIILWASPNFQAPWRPSYGALLRSLTGSGFAEISTGFAGAPFPDGSVFGMWTILHAPWLKLASLLPHASSARPEMTSVAVPPSMD